jgi:hypothetical protein
MANSKISALTSATTPVAGTEVLPIVQSSATRQVSVANLTAGRDVGMAGATSTDDLKVSAGKGLAWSGNTATRISPEDNVQGALIAAGGSFKVTVGGGTTVLTFNATTKDGTWSVGNLVQGTAGKGINFTANTPLAGMTSQLLNWYEEGTWTPAQGAGLTVVGTFSSNGRYTRIGRQVTVSGHLIGSTSIACVAANLLTNNLPISCPGAGESTGTAVNGSITASVGTVAGGLTLYASGALAASSQIYFSITYTI